MGIEVTMSLGSVVDYLRAANGVYRQLTADELLIMDAYAVAIVDEIADAWPVDTSTSRDAFTYYLENSEQLTGIVLENDVDYAQYVHYKGTDPEPPLWQTLIPAVWQRYRYELAAALFFAIDRTQRIIEQNVQQGGRGFLDIVSRKLFEPPKVGPHAPG